MSASAALQKAVFEALQADVALQALVEGRIFDVADPAHRFPYISFGPEEFRPERNDCFKRRTETLQIDVWTQDRLRRAPCRVIVDAVETVLDQVNLDLEGGYQLARFDLVLARVIDDPLPKTRHGILRFESEVTW